MVRLRNLFANHSKLLHDVAHLRRATTRDYSLIHRASISEQAYAISGIDCELSEAERGIDGAIEFAVTIGAGAHQAPAIEHDPDCLAALHAKRFRNQFPAPRRSRLTHIAKFIALTMLSQALEV